MIDKSHIRQNDTSVMVGLVAGLARLEERLAGTMDSIDELTRRMDKLAEALKDLDERLDRHEERWVKRATVVATVTGLVSIAAGWLAALKGAGFFSWLFSSAGSGAPPASGG